MNQKNWGRISEWPLLVAALAFLVAYSWQIIGDLHGTPYFVTQVTMWVAWVVFAIDYLANLLTAENKLSWVIRHLPELVIVALPALRPLRLLRLLTLVIVLQKVAGSTLRGRVVIYAIGGASLVSFIAAVAMLDAERGATGAEITTFPDAIWWAIVTITTVGYGDMAPVTGVGRLVAAGLMISGIALVGVVTASLASWLVEQVREEQEKTDATG